MKQLTIDDYLAAQPIFHGADINAPVDNPRLTKQILRVYNVMKDGRARTVAAIAKITGDPETSVSAQLRNLRKIDFGGYDVRRISCGRGLYEFKLILGENS